MDALDDSQPKILSLKIVGACVQRKLIWKIVLSFYSKNKQTTVFFECLPFSLHKNEGACYLVLL